jgi:glycosyltransferase involved in cell wall biosynthesis
MLVLLVPGFPANENDTSCLPAVQQFVLELKEAANRSVVVIAFQYPFQRGQYTWHGITVHSLAGKNRQRLSRVKTWIKCYLLFRKLHHGEKVTGILSFWLTECALVGQMLGRKWSIPHFMWIHGQDVRKGNRYIRLIRPLAHQVLALSPFVQLEMEKNYSIRPLILAENGVRESAFPGLNTGQRDIFILGAGSLTYLKNYELFLESISLVRKEFPELKAVIAGDESETGESLRLLARKLDLQQTLVFTGALPHEQVLDLMSRSRIFLHTSTYEASGSVLLEALYSGCQVVTTSWAGRPGIENVWVYRTASEIADACVSLLKIQAPPRRILYNSLSDTAKQVAALFTPK